MDSSNSPTNTSTTTATTPNNSSNIPDIHVGSIHRKILEVRGTRPGRQSTILRK